jgi:hypothetical protein
MLCTDNVSKIQQLRLIEHAKKTSRVSLLGHLKVSNLYSCISNSDGCLNT